VVNPWDRSGASPSQALAGEIDAMGVVKAMSEVCRAFGISRKTGYKIFERYQKHGLEALTDRSRRNGVRR
jgi:hypothetical protein